MNQLADELGVPVKEILARLNEQGVIVRSGSVAVPKRVARWLRDFYSTRDQDKPASVSGGPPSLAQSNTPARRKKRRRAATRENMHRLGIPVVSREQADKTERRKRNVDPEKVRKRVNELLGTTDSRHRQARPRKAADSGAQPNRKKRNSNDAGPKT